MAFGHKPAPPFSFFAIEYEKNFLKVSSPHPFQKNVILYNSTEQIKALEGRKLHAPG
ncbi:hypothetical protein CHY_2606 [Carboxydothermus hydrogenoformans Z-2901]|uniref:Uncharacterized protein n=1 Tax=Carboxydothermus hydrogenoformans (strain ATCC BAA-161 / DSM 6008 / Z-2901) TaxID=246194 RepID=Q3A8Y5_CARHZ|nr:hypothetical protein CHY_2606 [Carboxydothermus hydrogenoformans Z-2901]